MTLAEVFAAHDRAVGRIPPAYAQRRERWTYTHLYYRLPVSVAVRGDDVRIDVAINGGTYSAGRSSGVRWRADANGVAHRVTADLQGDAADRFPEAVFPIDRTTCSTAGETNSGVPAWVIRCQTAGDYPHWFFVTKSSGLIEKSLSREGKVVIAIVFDRFDATDGASRTRHWVVTDGDPAHAIDVSVDAITPGSVALTDVRMPLPAERRVFTPADPSADRVVLPAHFSRTNRISVDVRVAGRDGRFELDTGTTSITLNSLVAGLLPGGVLLEHARVGVFEVGALRMSDVSVLAVPFGTNVSGLLGYDFFFGHVVHIDYPHRQVEVLSHRAGDAAFDDPANTLLSAIVDRGMPFVHAQVGEASGDGFAIDTGSPRIVVGPPFVDRFRDEIANHWTRQSTVPSSMQYLEGRMDVMRYTASPLIFGPTRFAQAFIEANVPSDADDAIDLPFDGILGTDVLAHFDLWFDFDNARLAMRFAGT